MELSDYAEVHRHASRYAPFSDFNFICLWSWDVDGRVQICELNGNLVVQLTDYVTAEPFYTFLGDRGVSDTVATLVDLAARKGLPPALKLVPEIAARKLDSGVFAAAEDSNQADYILLVDRLCAYQGPKLAAKRNEVRKFLRDAPHTRFVPFGLDDTRVTEQCRHVFEQWHRRKRPSSSHKSTREFRAFERCLEARSPAELIGAGVFVGDLLAAFSLSEIVDEHYAFTHFEKADTISFPGVTAFLNQQLANLLASRGIRYINVEQDLGLTGLQLSKRSYAPCDYLRKFDISYRVRQAA
jgi:hypothetical protein